MPDLESQFAKALTRLCEKHDWPGATAAAQTRQGRLHAAAGLANVATAQPMRANDRLLPASIGKMVTSAVAVKLAEAGHIDLDAPVADALSHREWWTQIPHGDQITLRLLLQHRAGMRDYQSASGFGALIKDVGVNGETWIPPDQAIMLADADGPLYAPGTLTVYSDTGYLMAGLFIEAITGQRYYDLAQELVLTPAGMATCEPNDRPLLAGLVQGYTDPAGPFAHLDGVLGENGALVYHPRTEWTGGGFISTAGDLVSLAMFMFDGGLSAQSVSQLLQTHPIYDRTPLGQYGMGVMITPTTYGPSLGHTGSIPGYRSLTGYSPVSRSAISLMINCDAPDWDMLHDARETLGLIAAGA
jgi:D-alanyl-D-alanine carboxypeptidase